MKLEQALALIRSIPDYPKPGILFQDITPLLSDGNAFSAVTSELATFANECDVVAGIEARGFIFASALANQLNCGFVPIRKAGKLPHEVFSQNYGLEYGTDTLEIHVDALKNTRQVLLVDDVLATGGTLEAAIDLIEMAGGQVNQIVALLEIQSLDGRKRLANKYPNIRLSSLVIA
jgi:adenine phosphoribosyltransferase